MDYTFCDRGDKITPVKKKVSQSPAMLLLGCCAERPDWEEQGCHTENCAGAETEIGGEQWTVSVAVIKQAHAQP